jgi:hypothetical protein
MLGREEEEAEEAEKEMMVSAGKKGRNPNHGTGVQNPGQVTGSAAGKLQKYLQLSFRVLEFSGYV